MLTVLLLAGMLADMAGWWQVSSFDPFQLYFAWVSSLVCKAGWGGYSQGLWGIAGGIMLKYITTTIKMLKILKI